MTPEELNKACEWLEMQTDYYVFDDGYVEIQHLLEDFRKAMTDKTNPLFEQCLANVNPETREEVRRNMDYADWVEKACEVIDELCKGLQPHRRNFTIDEFRKAMGAVVKESLTTELTWQDVQRIVEIADQMIQPRKNYVIGKQPWFGNEQAYYTEVLRRFREN